MEERAQTGCAHEEVNVTCTNTSAHYAEIALPLKLRPYAAVSTIATECCGEPLVTVRPYQGAGSGGGCEICIAQALCIKVTVEYGTLADVGESSVSCKKMLNASGGCCR